MFGKIAKSIEKIAQDLDSIKSLQRDVDKLAKAKEPDRAAAEELRTKLEQMQKLNETLTSVIDKQLKATEAVIKNMR